MIQFIVLLIAILSGFIYYVLDQPYVTFAGLFLVMLCLRFNSRTLHLGKFVEILFIFFLISYIIEGFRISYPGSLIIVLTFLVILIFLEGPEWSKLYFSTRNTKAYLRLSLFVSALFLLLFGLSVYFSIDEIENPVQLPIDIVIMLGIGVAFYLPIMEEIIFRSFIFERAKSAAAVSITAVFAQGALYGFMLYQNGVPSGVLGSIVGGFFGVSLGYLVHKSGSIYPSMFAHFIVTLGIFIELAILG
ncbi:hypothetical protein GWO43_16360 [candidate division KSB1 bacterium]|nr:hypothetical protein [candidate division KSB1 bacterium]NIR68707.1 hypothetical protein [candidate division KSB1 bacterium]NIS25524.1 hypothetical protein [candidate division KSB1 bacterium]NIT72417.1 hypothetical protein [candidate division KSB1 bacterium]NIU26201.1 hypothetical protein [candidate division KSB1 bacterium]